MNASLPSVSVFVLNLNGRPFLEACLSSLTDQHYPRDRFEVVLIDNGSTDDSVAFVRKRYPTVRVYSLPTNGGFCAPHNVAIRECSSEFVALLNNDARVDSQWLAELVSAAERHQAAAVASKILSWTGETIDFVGGVTSFIGHSWQLDFREPATREYGETSLLFPCAGSALYSRQAFLDAGAFDEDFFAYFEDVDLGWRLNLFGERTVLAPKAVTYHRIHGTSSKWALAQRVRLLERNALAMIYKNYEDETLSRILPAAIALLLLRATMRSGIDELSLNLSQRPLDAVQTNPFLIAHLIGLEDFCRMLPQLRSKREAIQRRRRRSDAELLELFVDPLRLHDAEGVYGEAAEALIRQFRIDQLFGEAPNNFTRSTTATPVKSAENRAPAFESSERGLPHVSIVILTALGATHLRECLDSLLGQTYPAERIQVVVVDNGSDEDPTDEVRARFPDARTIRNHTNIGFAAGNNQGAEASTGTYVVFLNDDTRVQPEWLRELVAVAQRRKAAAVASVILDWSGKSIDFVSGAANFQGKGFQIDYGAPVSALPSDERPLLFACGCAMLVDRAVLMDVGGWDEDAFAYYEDVELGWRLHVLGHEVWLAPRAVVYHKHHGTSGCWPEPPRLRLYERNSLRAIYRLLETESLERALPAALLLAVDRALLASGLSRAAEEVPYAVYPRMIDGGKAALRARGITRSMPLSQALGRLGPGGLMGLAKDVWRLSAAQKSRSRRAAYLIESGGTASTFDGLPQSIPIDAAAILSGIYGFLADIPKLASRRADVQNRRRVSDREILAQFGTHWLSPSGASHPAQHQTMHEALVAEFKLAALGDSGTPATSGSEP